MRQCGFRAPQAAPAPSPEERIPVKDGAETLYLKPADIAWVEAAGNYVELNTQAGQRLIRGTLASWQERLAAFGFVRVHRARLVNRAHIAAIAPTEAGDFTMTLASGQTLAGSRRYRAALDATDEKADVRI